MDFAPIIAEIKAARCAGFRYQRAGHQRYRDRVTVYRDGRLLFERFGSLAAMAEAGEEALVQVPGIGKERAALISRRLALLVDKKKA